MKLVKSNQRIELLVQSEMGSGIKMKYEVSKTRQKPQTNKVRVLDEVDLRLCVLGTAAGFSAGFASSHFEWVDGI